MEAEECLRHGYEKVERSFLLSRLESISEIMNKINSKISKEKIEDEEGVLAMLRRLTKLCFLPKFLSLDIQAKSLCIYYKRLFLRWALL